MELLDAALAFALTMGALSTVVTVLMETAHRFLRIRKRNMIKAMGELVGELKWLDQLEPGSRWSFVCNVLNNPTQKTEGLPEKEPQVGCDDYLSSLLPSSWLGYIRDLIKSVISSPLLLAPGSGKSNWRFYDKVSLEHVLRRFAEIPKIKEEVENRSQWVVKELDGLARRYHEICSAVSADFKRRAQLWSLVAGIIFAFAANVDAIRIFDSYIANDELTAKIITAYPEIEASAAALQEKLQAYNEARKALSEAKKAGAEVTEIEKKEAEVAKLEEELDATALMAKLTAQGVPIGWAESPITICWKIQKETCAEAIAATSTGSNQSSQGAGSDGSPQEDTSDKAPGTFLGKGYLLKWDNSLFFLNVACPQDNCGSWLFGVIITGLLLGLGGPFWFDTAKRIAQVRTAFGGKASAEERLSGKSEVNSKKERGDLAKEIVEDVKADKIMLEDRDRKLLKTNGANKENPAPA